jgi:heme exporter protein D
MNFGPYAGFIIAAYGAALVVVATLIGWVIADHRAQLRTLGELEARGVARRSAGAAAPREAA